MRCLLCSEFRRLWRSKLFYLGILAVALEVLYALVNNLYYKRLWDLELTGTNLLFMGMTVLPIAMAVFIAFFVSVDHGDKTVRNKVVAGYSKVYIYLAKWITCAVAALLMYVVGSGIVIAVGGPLLGGFPDMTVSLVLQMLCSLISVVALSSLLLLFGVLIQNRPVAVIATMLCVIALQFLVLPAIFSALNAPETVGGFTYLDDGGVLHEIPEQPNPEYPTGGKRVLLQAVYDILPMGQLFSYGGEQIKNLALYPVYGIAFCFVTTLGGAWGFYKRDLK